MSRAAFRNHFDRSVQFLRTRVGYPVRERFSSASRPTRGDLLFIHIPKTAGTSIHRSLGLPDRGHHLFSKLSPGRAAAAEKVVFALRDPFDRLVSTYRYLDALGRERPLRGRLTWNIAIGRTFEEFLASDDLAAAVRDHYFYKSQFAYLDGIERVRDKLVLLRSERLAEDMEQAFGISPGHLNRSPSGNDTSFDSSTNRERVRELYRDDYERLPTLLERCGIERPDWMD